MVNTWLKTVKKVNATLPKGTLLKDVLKKAKSIQKQKKQKRQNHVRKKG